MKQSSSQWTAPSLKVAIFCLVSLFVVVTEAADPYHPGSMVKRYHAYEFDFTASYGTKVAKRCAPILIVGLLIVIAFLIWSCGRCCKCCRPTKDMKDSTKIFLFVLLAAIGAAGIVMLSIGFKAESKQTAAMNDIPGILDEVVYWKDSSMSYLADLNVEATNVSAIVEEIQTTTANLENYVSNDTLNAIFDAADMISNITADVNGTVTDMNLEKMRDDIRDGVDSVDGKRHQAVVALLAVLLGLLLLQIFISFLNAFGPGGCKPKKSCFFITPVITALFLFILLLAWILATILFALSTGFADLCYDPDGVVLKKIDNITGFDKIQYFVLCDENTTLVNPLATQMSNLTTQFQKALDEFDIAYYNTTNTAGCLTDPDCYNVTKRLERMNGTLLNMQTTIGVDTNNDGNYETGILSKLNCTNLNGLYQEFPVTLCSDFFPPLASLFEVIIAFACLMTLAEFFKRKLDDADNRSDDDEKWDKGGQPDKVV